MKFRLYIILFLLTAHPLLSNGLEFRLTLSGKLLIGIAYRHQIDTNTAVRLGSYIGLAGAPVGLHLGMMQDIRTSTWTPFFELGADMLFYKQNDKIGNKIFPSGSVGLSYCTANNLKHSGELGLWWTSGQLNPVGLSYVHYNTIN